LTPSLDSGRENRRTYRYYDLVMSAFVAVLILSNIASSAKIIDWGVSLYGIPLAFDAGTLLFPISYIFGDILTEVYGYRRSRRVIWAGFSALALSSLFFALVRALPGEKSWQAYAGQAAYDSILGGFSSGGIVLASLLAFFAGEFSNSFILAKMKLLTQGKRLWMRTIASTLVGEGVDSLLFVLVATFFGVFPWAAFLSIVSTNYIFKVGIEVIMTPATYRLVNFLKKREAEDYFDWNTNFNPFKT
jgi:queuosine precursor transporter